MKITLYSPQKPNIIMKKRISLTVDDRILKKVDDLINNNDIRNRSHAVEHILRKYFDSKKIRKAVILAGGKGIKVGGPEMPRQLISIKGRTVIDSTFDYLKGFGVEEVVMCVGHMADQIISHLGNEKFGIRITYVIEHDPLGTAGPLRLADKHLDDTFMMLNGDIIADVDLDDMLEFHRSYRGIATIALAEIRDPKGLGVAELKGSRIIRFREKPSEAASSLVNAGVYILDRRILDYIGNGKVMIEEVFSKLAEKNLLFGYPFRGKWYNISKEDMLESASKEL